MINIVEISVVIITRNRKNELKRSLISLFKQNFKNYEIIIVNNNSIDGTELFLKEIVKNYNISIPVIIKNLEKNYGVAGGRNIGFKMSKGKYVYFIDDDAYIKDHNFLLKLHNFMQDNPDVGALATRIYDTRDCIYNQTKLIKKYNDSFLYEVFIYKGGSHAIRKSIYDQGEFLYPSNLFFGSEEYYASIIVANKGYKIILNDKLEVIHSPGLYSELNKEGEKIKILVNKFIVKKYLFPKIFYPCIYFTFFIRIILNCKFNMFTLKKIVDNYSTIYDKHFLKPVKMSTIFLSIKKYGFKIF